MTLLGQVQNGVVVFRDSLSLPEGTLVRVEPLPVAKPVDQAKPTLLELLGDVVGACDDLPEDLARNHDHYLYGTAKRP